MFPRPPTPPLEATCESPGGGGVKRDGAVKREERAGGGGAVMSDETPRVERRAAVARARAETEDKRRSNEVDDVAHSFRPSSSSSSSSDGHEDAPSSDSLLSSTADAPGNLEAAVGMRASSLTLPSFVPSWSDSEPLPSDIAPEALGGGPAPTEQGVCYHRTRRRTRTTNRTPPARPCAMRA